MKNIIFIAPPAAGKGTQSELLVKKYGYVHISTGDLLREEIERQTELGKSIAEGMSKGQLVSTEIVTTLLKNRLCQDDIQNGFILDGYPREIEQCKELANILEELNLTIDVVLYLDLDEKTSMHRALGRITCPKCNRGYNKYEVATMPKEENLCDDCHVELVGRSDDTEETFAIRFKTYLENTQPILDYYKEKGILRVIDNSGTPENTFSRIEDMIND